MSVDHVEFDGAASGSEGGSAMVTNSGKGLRLNPISSWVPLFVASAEIHRKKVLDDGASG